jgi:PAS domain S-box-containing protein
MSPHYVIKYIEPLADNRPAWGLDLGFEAVRRAGLERAIASGETTLTGQVVLVQDEQGSPGFLLIVPIYRHGTDPQNEVQRDANLRGLVYAPLVAREIFGGVTDAVDGLLALEVSEGGRLVFSTKPEVVGPRFVGERLVRFGGRELRLRLRGMPAFEQRVMEHDAEWLALGGLLLSGALALAGWSLGSRRERAEALARGMTRELERLARVARGTTNAVFSTDAQLRIDWVNEGFTRITGYSAEEARGRTPGELLGSGLADPAVLRTLAEAAAAGRGSRVEILNRRKDGELVWVETELQPLHDEAGRLTGFIEIALDITERKRAAEQLWQERERLANIIEGTGAGTWEWNVQSGEVRFNERWAGMLGYTLAELAPVGFHTWTNLAHPEDLAASEPLLLSHLRGDSAQYEAEVRVRHKDGHWVWVLTRGKLYAYTPQGEPLWVAGTHLDITARKLSEQALADSEAVLERAGRIAGVGGWQIDLSDMRLHWTAQTFRIHDLDPGQRQPGLEEALEFYDLAGRLAIKAAVRRAFRQRESADLELRLTTALGRFIWVRAVGEPEFEGDRVVRVNGTLQDITERRALEDAMRRSNEVLRSVLDNLPCALSVFDADLNLLAYNQQFRQLLEFPDSLFEPETRGLPVRFEDIIRFNARRGEYGPTSDVEAMVEDIIARARGPELHQFERVRPNGAALEVRGAPMPGGGFVTTYVDISERKRLEAERQRSAELMQVMLENLPCGLTMFDAQMRLTLHNTRYAQMYELDEAFFAEQSVTVEKVALMMQRRGEYGEISTAQALEAAFERARDAMRAPHFWERERPGGLVLEMRSAPLAGGGFVTTYTDVSEQRRAAAELSRTLAVLKAVLEAASKVAIIATDHEGIINVFNRGAELMLGYPAAEMVGQRTPRRLHAPEELAALGGFAGLTAAQRLGVEQQLHYVRRDGSRIPVLFVVTEMRDARGGLLGFLGVAYDITRQKEAEAELREAMAAAEQASAAKSQFLANMSHEIRTPMNAILGMLRLLARTPLDARQRGYADKTEGAARSLLALLNDILDFSKVEAGKLELDPQPFAPARLLADLEVILRANLGARPLALHIELDPALPAGLLGDAMRLQQVLINLGGNALKFTEQGVVTVALRRLGDSQGGVQVEFRVSDTGIGIAPEHQDKIFAGFTQAEASTTRRFGGTGLGLAISQRLVRAMGGELRLSSVPGQGSEFFFTLALPETDPPAAEPAAASLQLGMARLAGLRLLVVEDNPNNQQVARELLEDEGARVVLAGDGRQALELLARDPAAFDLVLMDVQMPVMDGYSATRAMRADAALARLPVVAMTANAMPADLEAARAAGMDAHVGKPFEIDHLVAVICRQLGRAAAAAPRAAPPLAPGLLPPALVAQGLAAGLDMEAALQRLMGKTELLARLSRSLAATAEALPAELRALLAAGDAAAAAAALHSFKGLAATLGADRLAELARQGETRLKAGDSLAPAWVDEGGLAGAVQQGSALLRALAEALPAPAAAAVPLDLAAVRAALAQLVALLRSADMAALDALESLRASAAAGLDLEGLDDAMAQLDFARALQYCEQLMRELSDE